MKYLKGYKIFKEFENLSKLLLESEIIYSDKFKKVLGKIDSNIARKILELENKDLPIKSNYLDISSTSNDKVTFIPDAKVKEISEDDTYYKFIGRGGGWLRHTPINKKIFDILDYEPVGEEYIPKRGEIGKEISKMDKKTKSGRLNYIYLEFTNGKSGVFNKNKLEELTTDQVKEKNRQAVKIGRIANILLSIADYKATPSEIEEFVNLFKSTVAQFNKISLIREVTGEEIHHWYRKDQIYESRKGGTTIMKSCMNNATKEQLDIYIKNPQVCRLIILLSPDKEKVAARGLLWTLKGGETFLDRVYAVEDSDIKFIREWALEEGHYVKFSNDSKSTSIAIKPDRTRALPDMSIQLLNIKYKGFPYMDTFKYYFRKSKVVSSEFYVNGYLLEDLGGGVICPHCDEGYVECGLCNGTGTGVMGRCTDCGGDGNDECEFCNGAGTLTID